MSKTESVKYMMERESEIVRETDRERGRLNAKLNFGFLFNSRKLLTEGHAVNHKSGSQPWLHRQAARC